MTNTAHAQGVSALTESVTAHVLRDVVASSRSGRAAGLFIVFLFIVFDCTLDLRSRCDMLY